jgi:hypothetical protein
VIFSSSSVSGFKPLKCKYCFRPFGDPSNLNKHIRLHTQGNDHHHNQHHHHNPHSNSSTENQAAYRCHICNKSLLKRRDLLRHMQLSHSRTSNISETQSSGQEDSQMTLLYSPALSSPISSSTSSSSKEEEEDEEAEVVD